MARLPAAPQRIGPGSVPGEPPEAVYGHSCRCGNPATSWHHIVRRSVLGGPFSCVEIDGLAWGNLVPLCQACHDAVEHVGNPDTWADIVLPTKEEELFYIFFWYSHRDKEYTPLRGVTKPVRAASAIGGSSERVGTFPAASAAPPSQPAPPVEPGSKCPTCNRRVNHKKTEASPVSSTISQRLPVDEKDSMKQLIADTAETIGADGLKYPQAKTVEVGMVLIGRHHAEALEIVKEMAA